MTQRLLTAILVMALLVGITAVSARAAEIVAEQVDLHEVYANSGIPWEITPDGVGNLIISDDSGIIWKVNPATGAYAMVDTGIVGLTSAVPGDDGYYFSNNVDSIGYTDFENSYLWDIPLVQASPSIGRLTLDPNGKVWFIEAEGESPRIFHFSLNNPNPTVCRLDPESELQDFGTYAYDLDYHDGYLWWFNWSQEQIVRFNPVADETGDHVLDYWQLPAGSTLNGGRENAFDDAGNFWIAGGGAGTLIGFNTLTNVVTIFTVPEPDSSSIVGVTINEDQIWYADDYSSVGVLDPNEVVGKTLGEPLQKMTIKLHIGSLCEELESSERFDVQSNQGTLVFSLQTFTPRVTSPGWIVYDLPDENALNGINATSGMVLVSSEFQDNGFSVGKLIRFSHREQVFLPLITR